MAPGTKKPKVKQGTEDLRRQAEKKLADRPGKSSPMDSRTPEELIQELQVHQIELEMQNEALREAHLALEVSRDKYLDLYEFAPVGYLTLTLKALIKEANLTIATQLGIGRRDLIKDRFRRFVVKEDLEYWDRHFIAVQHSAEKLTCELKLLKRDGSRFHARLESIRTEMGGREPVIRMAIIDITEQKRGEDRLKVFQAFTENAEDIILFIRKRDGKIIEANRKASQVYGYTHDELLSMTVFSLRLPVTGKHVDRQMEEAGATGILFETVHRRKDGSTIPVEINSFSLQLNDEPVLFSIIRDITRRKLAEEQLLYDALIIDIVHDAIIMTKNVKDFPIIYWNQGAEKIYGWKKEEVLGRNAQILLRGEFPGRDRKSVLSDIFKTGTYEGEVVHPRKDGTRIIIDSRLMARMEKNGEITDWIAINRDITARKRSEEVINLLSEERKTLIENVPAMIWYKDTHNNYIRVNPAGALTIGLPVEAIEGKSAYDLFPENAENYYLDDLEVIRSGIPKFGIIEQMKTAGGRNLWVRTEKIPLKDERGTVTGVLVFSVDITDIKLADDELISRSEQIRAVNIELTASSEDLREKERALREALAEKEVLLSEIHHRVKNNLTAFISLLSLDATCEDTEGGRALRKDLQNRARSMALIHETLYRTGKFSDVDMEIYLTTLIGQIASSYAGSAAIRTNVEAQGVVLDLARATTAGLIINELVTNSFKYAFPQGFDCQAVRGEPCTIRVSFTCRDGTYVLTVADNGLGLPAGLDPLATKSLGLKLVNFLARHQLRAEIGVCTDKGAEFIFRFNNIIDTK